MKCPGMKRRGVALIAVLWLVAAMGLIITGVVQAVRSEARTIGLQRQALAASALADAAILLAIQGMDAQKTELPITIQTIQVQFEGRISDVSVRPLNGLIDINNASALLLADLYHYAGGMDPGSAQALAQATIDARQTKNVKGTALGFHSIEDLLRVSGMTYDLYAKIKSLITSDLITASGRVNPMAAPLGVLQVLSGGDVSRAAIFAANRDANPNLMDSSFFKPDHIEMTTSDSLQFQVGIGMPDGGLLSKAWRVSWSTDPRSGLPWHVLGSQQSVQRMRQPNN